MSVRKRCDNDRWMVEFTFKHADGRKEIVRKTSPVNNKRGAEQYETMLRQQMFDEDQAPKAKPQCPTFGEYAETFMVNYAKVENKPSEVASKGRILKNHLLLAFGRKPLDSITRDDIKAYRSKKLEAGLCAKTINNHTTVLTRILAEAVESGLVEFVPRVRRLRVPPPESDFLTVEEAHNLALAAEGQFQVMIIVALSTGLRQGELLGLQWKDINLEQGVLTVRHSIFRGRVGTPKSHKERMVPLNTPAVDALLTLKRASGGYVFSDEKGKPLTDNLCKWPLKRACVHAGLRQVSWHVLRHTFASHLVQSGVSLMQVQQYLGHSDMRTTQRYAHLSPNVSHEAVNLLPSYRTYIARNVIPFRKCSES